MIRSMMCTAALGMAIASLGCGGVKEETIVVKNGGALQEAKSILDRYSKGQPLGSEAAGFPRLVTEVRKEDPAKADILEKGLKEIEASKGNRAAIAKDTLNKL